VEKATDLDQIIKAHDGFLESITKHALLDLDKRELLNQLRGVLGTVLTLKDFLTKFDDRVTKEMRSRRGKAYKETPQSELDARNTLFMEYIQQAKVEIERIYDVTQVSINIHIYKRRHCLLVLRLCFADALRIQIITKMFLFQKSPKLDP